MKERCCRVAPATACPPLRLDGHVRGSMMSAFVSFFLSSSATPFFRQGLEVRATLLQHKEFLSPSRSRGSITKSRVRRLTPSRRNACACFTATLEAPPPFWIRRSILRATTTTMAMSGCAQMHEPSPASETRNFINIITSQAEKRSIIGHITTGREAPCYRSGQPSSWSHG